MEKEPKAETLKELFSKFKNESSNEEQISAQSKSRAQAEQLNVLQSSIELEEEQVDKLGDIEEYLERIEEALIGIEKNFKDLPKELSSKGPEFSKIKLKEEDKTTKESFSEFVGSIKQTFGDLGKGIKSTFDIGKKFVKDPAGTVKEGLKKAGSSITDVFKAEANYNAESDRFASERIKQEKNRREKEGKEPLSEEEEKDLRKTSRKQYRDIVDSEDQLKEVQGKIQESKKYGFTPVEEDVLKKNELVRKISKQKEEAGIPDTTPVVRKGSEELKITEIKSLKSRLEELKNKSSITKSNLSEKELEKIKSDDSVTKSNLSEKELEKIKSDDSVTKSNLSESTELQTSNNSSILQKAVEELSLIRKLTEGSVQYDKEAAQYRNTSGREVTSKTSGKKIKDGGFVDFETATDRLSGQSKRVRETESNVTSRPKEASKIISNVSDTNVSEEDDNVQSAQEIIADASKEDVKLTKEINNTLKEQLIELKIIKESITGTSSQVSKKDSSKENKKEPEAAAPEESGGLGFELPGLELGRKAFSRIKAAGSRVLGGIKSIGSKALGGIKTAGSAALKFAGTAGGKIAGGALALGAGAYTAYKGLTGAEEEKQAALQEIDTKVASGEITPAEAEKEKKQVGEATVEKKGGAIGEGTGMAAGGIVGMKAGAALGATVGSIVPGVGTAIGAGVGALAGGALGAFAGSKLGKKVGEYGGKAVNVISNFFGGNKNKENEEIIKSLPEGARPVKSEGEIVGYTMEGEPGIMAVPGKEDKLKIFQQKAQQTVSSIQSSSEGNTVTAKSVPTLTGVTVAQGSTEKADLEREAGKAPTVQPIISNNVTNSNSQTMVPITPRPRMGDGSSALDRYQSRIAVY